MNDENSSKPRTDPVKSRGILASILVGLAEGAVKMIVAFAIGTGASAIVCWYYGVPLAFSIVGGILVLGIALALTTDSLFY